MLKKVYYCCKPAIVAAPIMCQQSIFVELIAKTIWPGALSPKMDQIAFLTSSPLTALSELSQCCAFTRGPLCIILLFIIIKEGLCGDISLIKPLPFIIKNSKYSLLFLFNLHTFLFSLFFLIYTLLPFSFLITFHIYFRLFFHPCHSLFNILTYSFISLSTFSVYLSYFCTSSLVLLLSEVSKLK